jgi:hypothetical protein
VVFLAGVCSSWLSPSIFSNISDCFLGIFYLYIVNKIISNKMFIKIIF